MPLIVLATAAATGVQAAPAESKSKSDLVIDNGFAESHIAVQGGTLTFKSSTANNGSRKARATTTGVVLVGDAGRFALAGGREVKPLKPKKSSTGSGSASVGTIPLGRYRAELCADVEERVRESNEKNNCVDSEKGRIYVVARTWNGQITAVLEPASPFSSSKETWLIEVTFTINEQRSPVDNFYYTPTGTATNTGTGCQVSIGNPAEGSYLYFDGDGDYEVYARDAGGACRPGEDTWGSAFHWWQTGGSVQGSLTATELTGSYADDGGSSADGGNFYTWSLTAGP